MFCKASIPAWLNPRGTMRPLTAIAIVLALTATATAKHRHHARIYSTDTGTILPHPYGCPRIAFCGCGVSVKVFGRPVRSLFPAAAYYRFPRAPAAPGMVAIWSHHVAYIEALDANGNAVLYDPNSGGHQTRRHLASLAGATIVNPR